MKYFLAFSLVIVATNCVNASPCPDSAFGGLGNLLGGLEKTTGSVTKVTGGLSVGGIKENHECQFHQPVQDANNNQAQKENDVAIDAVASELVEIFDMIMETAKSADNTDEVVNAIVAVSDVVYATLTVMSTVNNNVLSDPNALCELSAYLEAAIEKLLERVNGVVLSVAAIVDNLPDDDDDNVVILEWVIEAIIAAAGNVTNSVSEILETTIEVASEPVKEIDIKQSLAGLSSSSAFSETPASGIARTGVIRTVDFKSTLRGVTTTISSLVNNLALKNVTKLVGDLVGSVSGAIGGLLKGATGTLSGTLKAVGGIAGGILTSLNGITGGATEIVSQLTSQVSSVAKLLSHVTLSLTQVITVVVAVIGNISTISNRLTGILKTLKSVRRVGGSSSKILPCKA